MGLRFSVAVMLCALALCASAQSNLTPQQMHELAQKYARAEGLCSNHGAGSTVAKEQCPRAEEYRKRLSAAGIEPHEALSRLFDGCRRYGSAYLLAGTARDTRQAPEQALASLKAEKWLKANEKTLKDVVNTAYFEPWAVALPAQMLARAMENDCRYGPDPSWKPLK